MSVVEVRSRCCCCLEETDLFSMIEPYNHDGRLEIYSNMILECFGIDMTVDAENVYKDFYVMCKSCISHLRNAFQFRDQVQNAYNRIQDIMYNYVPAAVIKHEKKLSYALVETARESNDIKVKTEQIIIDNESQIRQSVSENEIECYQISDKTNISTHSKQKSKTHDDFYLTVDSDLTSIYPGNSQEFIVVENIEDDDMKSSSEIIIEKVNNVEIANISKNPSNLVDRNVVYDADYIKDLDKDDLGKFAKGIQIETDIDVSEGDLTCKICGKNFNCLMLLRQHMSFHFHDRICVICKKMFATKVSLVRHLRHHEDMKITNVCNICNKTIKGSNFKRHMKAHEIKKTKKELEGISSQNVLELEQNETHESIVQKENEKSPKIVKIKIVNRKKTVDMSPLPLDENDLTCKVCNEKFVWHRTLKQHMAIHYPNYICHICSKPFITSRNLTNHIRRHKDTNIIRTCDICKKNIKGRENFDRHVKSHTSVRHFYKCPLCPEKFSYFRQKSIHLINVHNDESKIYRCKLCEKGYNSSGRLSKHVQTVHLKIKKHKCNLCHMEYSTKTELNRHLVRHIGINEFCEVCGKSFKKKTSLIEHMKNHKNDKQFVCDICHKSFLRKCLLKTHLKVHNKNAVKKDLRTC